MRTIAKQVELGKILCEDNPHIDLVYAEIKQLLDEYQMDEAKHGVFNALYCLINNSFYTGVSVGYRRGFRERNQGKKQI